MAAEKTADEKEAGGAADDIEGATRAAEQDVHAQIRGERAGMLTVYGCPDCGGVLWQTASDGPLVFRCHVGHVFSAESLLEQQFSAVEVAGWTAIRALADRTRLLRQMSVQAGEDGDAETAAHLDGRAAAAEERAAAFRVLMEAGE